MTERTEGRGGDWEDWDPASFRESGTSPRQEIGGTDTDGPGTQSWQNSSLYVDWNWAHIYQCFSACFKP